MQRFHTVRAPVFRHSGRMRCSLSPIASLSLAGVCWGTSFGAAALLDDTSPAMITGVRFGFFGLVSLALLGRSVGIRWVPWRVAILHAAGGSVGLYLSEVIAIDLVGAGPTIAVVGSVPLVYASFGARRDGEPFRPLIPSLVLTVFSHLIIHVSSFRDAPASSPWVLVAGLLIAAAGVLGFCAYAFHLTDFLRENPQISAARWSSAIGIACGVWAIPLLTIGILAGSTGVEGRLIIGGFFLAIVPSWLAATLWNTGVVNVQRSLAGQLLVVEPLAAFVFVHLATWTIPGSTLVIGELLLLAGALLAVRRADHSGAQRSSVVVAGVE
jgi:drug/metabolite transporter (DMT)-like permease